ncbi:MAG: helix-turn-helix transcriptional regulator [Acidobacteriia bacterium]|nr:helix-turn-helix transcriptional regulator [Terriglobia bacterium]MBV8904173.1 helix-turn-helix transcriptional regulator [Terriglobia bacterium]
MSRKTHSRAPSQASQAQVFAALGDATRLALIRKLADGQRRSISQLSSGSKLTRQAITKHLRVLEHARIVHGTRTGRESLFVFNPEPIEQARTCLDSVSEQWDQALARLKLFVEK